jgi:hypothetical protein
MLFTCIARAVRGTGGWSKPGSSALKAEGCWRVGGTSIFASFSATTGVTYSASEPESRRKMFSHLLLLFFLSSCAGATGTATGTGGTGSAALEISRARIWSAVASWTRCSSLGVCSCGVTLPVVGVALPFPRAARRRRRAPAELPLALLLFAPSASSSDSASDSMATGGSCVEMESEGGALSRKLARSESMLSRSRSYGSI